MKSFCSINPPCRSSLYVVLQESCIRRIAFRGRTNKNGGSKPFENDTETVLKCSEEGKASGSSDRLSDQEIPYATLDDNSLRSCTSRAPDTPLREIATKGDEPYGREVLQSKNSSFIGSLIPNFRPFPFRGSEVLHLYRSFWRVLHRLPLDEQAEAKHKLRERFRQGRRLIGAKRINAALQRGYGQLEYWKTYVNDHEVRKEIGNLEPLRSRMTDIKVSRTQYSVVSALESYFQGKVSADKVVDETREGGSYTREIEYQNIPCDHMWERARKELGNTIPGIHTKGSIRLHETQSCRMQEYREVSPIRPY